LIPRQLEAFLRLKEKIPAIMHDGHCKFIKFENFLHERMHCGVLRKFLDEVYDNRHRNSPYEYHPHNHPFACWTPDRAITKSGLTTIRISTFYKLLKAYPRIIGEILEGAY
jgi:hypothetical protein